MGLVEVVLDNTIVLDKNKPGMGNFYHEFIIFAVVQKKFQPGTFLFFINVNNCASGQLG